MQGDLQNELEKLGFTERQARIYLTLLRFGKAGAQQLSLACGVPRASCYDTLQQLIVQGLVRADQDNGQQVFSVESPERINVLLALQFEEILARRHRAEQFLPRLQALTNDGESRPRFRIITDLTELKALHLEFAELGQPFLQLVGYDAYLALYRDSVVQENIERLQQKRSRGRAILITDVVVDAPAGAEIEVRRVPTAMLEVKGEMTVCGDRVLLFAFTKDLVAIEIVSAVIANTCLATLELAWQQAGEIQKQLKGKP